MLAGGLATLAPLAAGMSMGDLPTVVRRMEERLAAEAPPGEAGMFWTATYVLMGLKYSRQITAELLKGVRQMKDSVTYQAILEEGEARGEVRGRAAEARSLVLRLGRKRFGPPAPAAEAALENEASVERLEQLAERLLEVESWDELLA